MSAAQATLAIRDALDRLAAENKRLRASAQPAVPVRGRHCSYCGHPVCGCGLQGYDEED